MPLPSSIRLKNSQAAVIRSALPEDAEAWIENVNAVGAERVFVMTERLLRSLDEVRAQFRDADPAFDLWLAAEVEGQIVGGADFRRSRHSKHSHAAELGIAILREFRGLGLGRAMLEAGIDWAKSVGVRKLKLGVFATNDRALALYRKLGFIEEARLKGEVILDDKPVDEVLMALWL